jgi:hypothetical protein
MPVRVIPCKARHFQSHYDSRAAQAHLSNQVLEALTPSRRSARLTLIAVYHDDLILVPAERHGPTTQSVLTLRAFHILDDLPHGRLSNIQVGASFEMMRLHFQGIAHGVAPRGSAFIAMAAKI